MFGIEKEEHIYDVTRETQEFLNRGARGIVMNEDTHRGYCINGGRKKVHLKPVFEYEEDDNDVPWDDYGTDRLRIVGPSGNTRVVLPDEDDYEYVVKRKPKRKTTRHTKRTSRTTRASRTTRVKPTKRATTVTRKKTAVKIKSEVRKNSTLCAVEFYNNNNDVQRVLKEEPIFNAMPLTTEIALSSSIVHSIGTQYENGTKVRDFIDEGFDKDTVHTIVQNRQAINLRKETKWKIKKF